MFRKSLLLALTSSLLAAMVLAGGTKKPMSRVNDVRVCPMTGEAVKGSGAGSEVVGNYRMHFCCAGCQPEFDKLTVKQKKAKIAAVLKKSAGKKG